MSAADGQLASPASRFAIYYAPPEESPLGRFGSRWLGRSAATGRACEQFLFDGLAPEHFAKMTSSPRHYGFHATLKAPFQLRDGACLDGLIAAVSGFAQRRSPFELPGLQMAWVGEFLALVLKSPSPPMEILARDCVMEFDRFRAPLLPEEIERRKRAALTPRQEGCLLAWGYPYVMEEFRFHMTLTNALPEPQRRELTRAAGPRLIWESMERVLVDSVCLFGQASQDEPFRVVKRFELGARHGSPGR